MLVGDVGTRVFRCMLASSLHVSSKHPMCVLAGVG
jgi:hypothetical protein